MRTHYFIIIIPALVFLFEHAHGQRVLSESEQLVRQATDIGALEALAEEFRQEEERQRQKVMEYVQRTGAPLIMRDPEGNIAILTRIDEFGNPEYTSANNTTSAGVISTDDVHGSPFNLLGSGMRIGEWDGGNVLSTHQQFAGRVTNHDASPNLTHSTHVCGTLIGDGTGFGNAKGMAPQATVDAYDFIGDQGEMTLEASNALLISNHSYGITSGWDQAGSNWHWYGDITYSQDESYYFGWYSSTARAWDVIAHTAPYYLIVKSAGNDRNDNAPASGSVHTHFGSGSYTDDHAGDCSIGNGYDCIPTQGAAKNILTVGAVEDDGTTMSSFSAWGPTDDGRIKPDVVANGVTLGSASSLSNTSYTSLSGTSMASPSCAGSAILLQEHYQNLNSNASMRSSTLKALILHTADDLDNTGPDYKHGWGRMNTQAAAQLISDNGNFKYIIEGVLNDGETMVYNGTSDGSTPIKATLCWTDVEGSAISSNPLDNSSSNLVNDLDMRITNGSVLHYPYVLNPASPTSTATTGDNFRDNVEQVNITSILSPLHHTVSVVNKGSLTGGSQHFSLIITGLDLSCVNDLVLTTNIIHGPIRYDAGNTITANNTVDVNDAPVYYQAKNYISLTDGFYAKEGAPFLAYIGNGCGEDPEMLRMGPLTPVLSGDQAVTGTLHSPGAGEIAGLESPDNNSPIRVYPMPFTSTTTFDCYLPFAMDVAITIYDEYGHTVKLLSSKQAPGGHHLVVFDGAGLPPGVYFYKALLGGDHSHHGKLILAR